MNEFTEQFLEFYSVDKLNKWLEETSNLIYITYRNTFIPNDGKITYIIGFKAKNCLATGMTYQEIFDAAFKIAKNR